MSGDNEKLSQKWTIIKEQLIALCEFSKLPKGDDEFKKLLVEDIELKNLNAQNLHAFLYHILGILNSEDRNKLIQWPLINIKTYTKFRKGVSAMVNNFQIKYPWAHIKKLPESYFMNPHGYQSRVLDFVSRLTNLAIHIALDDPELLMMHCGDGLNPREISIMTEVVSKAREEEERKIRNNLLPLKEIEDAMNGACDKCIALLQKNDDLQQELNNLKKHARSENLIPNGKDIDINSLKEVRDKNLSELKKINEELSKYSDLSKVLLEKLNKYKNPISLRAENFGCEKTSPDLGKTTSMVCGNLCEFFQYIRMKNSNREEEEEDFYKKLLEIKRIMTEHNEALHAFLCTVSLAQKE